MPNPFSAQHDGELRVGVARSSAALRSASGGSHPRPMLPSLLLPVCAMHCPQTPSPQATCTTTRPAVCRASWTRHARWWRCTRWVGDVLLTYFPPTSQCCSCLLQYPPPLPLTPCPRLQHRFVFGVNLCVTPVTLSSTECFLGAAGSGGREPLGWEERVACDLACPETDTSPTLSLTLAQPLWCRRDSVH